MEIIAPGIILTVALFGEGDAIAAVFTEEYGTYRGLVRGAATRKGAALWQQGNLIQAKWVARLADQLGVLGGELVHPGAALAMNDAWALAILASACSVADGALPERTPQPAIFRGLLHMIAHLHLGAALLPELVRWELGLLRELGYGLDISACALTGAREGLAYVSPRTGRAVCAEAAGLWKERLLPLPAFLTSGEGGDPAQYAAGLRLAGHFLARNAFGIHHKPLPPARLALHERVLSAAAQLAS